uniref:Uncharacterized protein n=1 Tax=Panagrolaimus superbus TaxID=310955 RepID=A0A914Z7A3_9BILA
MLFDIPYFDQLPKGYQEAVKKLSFVLTILQDSNNSTKLKSMTKFVKTYTTISPIWEYMKRNTDCTENFTEQRLCHFYSYYLVSNFGYLKKRFSQKPLNKKIYAGAYSTILMSRITRPCQSMAEYKNFLQYSEEALKYPSENLKEIYLHYCINLGSFISDKIVCRYQRSLELFYELKAVEKDDEKWVEYLLTKVEDETFIITNFEFRLEEFPWSQRLWHFYIDFLKKINSKSILDVYSRYCRFFIADHIGQDDYCTEIERFAKYSNMNVTKWWIDIIKISVNVDKRFEILEKALSPKITTTKRMIKFAQKFTNKFEPVEEMEELIQNAKQNRIKCDISSKDILSDPTFTDESLCFCSNGVYFGAPISPTSNESNNSTVSSCNIVGNFETYKFQQFCFPKTICNYIFQNPHYLLQQKLLSTCKYFVILYQTPICCNIVIKMSPIPEFYEQSIKIPESSIAAVKNFYVTNSLDAGETENSFTISNLCSTVYKFDLKYLKLHTQNLTKREFEFLTAPGNIESAYMISVSITDKYGNDATLEEIMEKFPNATRLILCIPTSYSSETAQKMLQQKRTVKIEMFEVWLQEVEAESFCQFIKKNAAPYAQIYLHFPESTQFDILQNLGQKVREMLDTWEPQSEKPVIDILNF